MSEVKMWGEQIMLSDEGWENGEEPIYSKREYITYEVMAARIERRYHGLDGETKESVMLRLYVDCTNGVVTYDVEAYEKSLGDSQ